jgi:hypothetical protein
MPLVNIKPFLIVVEKLASVPIFPCVNNGLYASNPPSTDVRRSWVLLLQP